MPLPLLDNSNGNYKTESRNPIQHDLAGFWGAVMVMLSIWLQKRESQKKIKTKTKKQSDK